MAKDSAEASRYHQRGMEARGETWDLQLILNGDGTEETIATLAKFKRRSHLSPHARHRVIAAARAALLVDDGEPQGRIAEVNRLEASGLRALQGTGFWLNGFIGNLLSDFARGDRDTPQQVVLALADSIQAIEDAAREYGEDSDIWRRLTGKVRS